MAKQDNENNLLKNKKLIKRSKNIERFIFINPKGLLTTKVLLQVGQTFKTSSVAVLLTLVLAGRTKPSKSSYINK